MVDRVAGSNTERLVACITLWPKSGDLGPEHLKPDQGGPPEAYREVLRSVVNKSPHPNVHLLEGPDLLPGTRGLAPDVLHPTDYGHSLIAENLARALKGLGVSAYPAT